MWSFGSKREEPAQTPSGKTSDGDSGRELSPKGGGSLATKSRMFYKGKKLSSSSNHSGSKSNPLPPAIKSRTPNQEIRKKRQFTPGSTNRRKSAGNGTDDYIQDVDVDVDETSSGIEVSFPGSQLPGTAQGMKGKTPTAVISLKEQILQRQLVFKGHFSTVISASNQNAFSSGTNKWRPKGHRIPLLGISPAETGYSDILQLLKNTPVVDERTAVQQEFSLLETEISSLEHDRISLEQSADPSGSISGFNKENATDAWNVHKLLKDDAIKKQPLSVSERNTLQKQRGNSLTFHLSNNRTKEMLVLKLGGKQNSRSTSLVRNDDSITTIVPKNNSSIETGATTLQHVSLISTTNKAASNGGLYFSQDAGKSQSVGQLPNKLVQRLEKNEKGVEYLSYLSTGSRGCYFAKFQSGECWWGSAVEDTDFQKIMNAWDVYRVAFGPIRTIFAQQQALSNKPMLANSWIILSHDGKAVWKNLPSRLSDKLETRKANSAAPVEVSLGPGDSYFVRFLDGSIDYSLPSKIARICERIEERGGKITNISLHPDISHDFVIRHTELTR